MSSHASPKRGPIRVLGAQEAPVVALVRCVKKRLPVQYLVARLDVESLALDIGPPTVGHLAAAHRSAISRDGRWFCAREHEFLRVLDLTNRSQDREVPVKLGYGVFNFALGTDRVGYRGSISLGHWDSVRHALGLPVNIPGVQLPLARLDDDAILDYARYGSATRGVHRTGDSLRIRDARFGVTIVHGDSRYSIELDSQVVGPRASRWQQNLLNVCLHGACFAGDRWLVLSHRGVVRVYDLEKGLATPVGTLDLWDRLSAALLPSIPKGRRNPRSLEDYVRWFRARNLDPAEFIPEVFLAEDSR